MMPQTFWHNIRISVRIFARSKVYTTINLLGLVLGLTVSFILIIFAINELSYNNCFKNSDRIYRLIVKDKKGTKLPLAPLSAKSGLIREYSAIESVYRVIDLENFLGQVEIQKATATIPVSKFCCADPEIFNSLNIKILAGRRKNLLKNSDYVVISSDAAKRFFQTASPIGKHLIVYVNGFPCNLFVEGVFENLPWNSTFKPEFIAGIRMYEDLLRKSNDLAESDKLPANDLTVETYIQLKQKQSIDFVNSSMTFFCNKLYPNEGLTFNFQNLKHIYLNSNEIQNDSIVKGSKENIYIYLSLAFFILLLVTINYSMLSTARSAMRFKEIGVRKVLGATKSNLRGQLLSESLLLTLISFPLAFLVIGLIAPVIEHYYAYHFFFFSTNLSQYVGISAAITLCIGLLSGTYISIYLSSLDPLTALKSNYFVYKKVNFSKIFIVFQFLVTIVLFISLLTIHQQIKLFLGTRNGIDKENLIVLSVNQANFPRYFELKKTVMSCPDVSSLTGISVALPTNDMSMVTLKIPGIKTKPISFELLYIDYNFFKTLDISFLTGSDFSQNDTGINSSSVIINEEAVRQGSIKEPLNGYLGPFKIVGVVKDFNVHTLYKKIKPALFLFKPGACKSLVIRYKTGKEENVLDSIRRFWNEQTPDLPLEYKFYDQKLNALYIKEQNFGRVIGSFTFLAFIITGMGLFGLAMLIVERRMKEMSIRKVFGASPGNIIYLIQKEFIVFIIIAASIAMPLAWYFLSLWLNNFYYHVDIRWYLFILSVIAVGGFISLILLLKTLRILRENPSNALKYE